MGLTHLIPSLEPKLRGLYNNHRERAAKIDWSYHEFLPLDELRARPDAIPKLSPAIYTGVETALLTEVNLPWFTSHIYSVFKGSLAVMLDFLHTWTSEEDQHALLLETYLLLGDNGDHKRRAALRKRVIREGWATNIETHFGTIAYTAIQELATQTFYLRVADAAESEDRMLTRALRRLARDETLHMAFYRDAVKAHLEVEPNYIYPLAEMIMNFEWPGAGMPNFLERMDFLSQNIDYGPAEYYSQVIDVLWRSWDIDRLAPTLGEARQALARVNKYHQKLAKVAARYINQRKKVPVK
jgi:acyl-[acyl-carrier-protein] desaturase